MIVGKGGKEGRHLYKPEGEQLLLAVGMGKSAWGPIWQCWLPDRHQLVNSGSEAQSEEDRHCLRPRKLYAERLQ